MDAHALTLVFDLNARHVRQLGEHLLGLAAQIIGDGASRPFQAILSDDPVGVDGKATQEVVAAAAGHDVGFMSLADQGTQGRAGQGVWIGLCRVPDNFSERAVIVGHDEKVAWRRHVLDRFGR